jgi:hypothetical protein
MQIPISSENTIMLHEITKYDAGIVPKHAKRQNKRKQAILANIDKLVAQPKHAITDTTIKHYMFITDTHDTFFENKAKEMKLVLQTQLLIANIHQTLHVHNTDNGAYLLDEWQQQTFIKLPRLMCLQGASTVHDDVVAVKQLLDKSGRLYRGNSHFDIAPKYTTCGMYAQRNSRSINIHKHDNVQYSKMRKVYHLYQRAAHFARQVIPTSLLYGMQTSHAVVGWQTLEHNEKQQTAHARQTTNMWASCAASVNYVSACHVDQDFLWSCLTVLCDDDKVCTKSCYKDDIPPAVYFCFPRLGLAIALKPGDYLLFNPTEPHCVSMRETHYQNSEVFLLSFYLKTNVVGGNDNNSSNYFIKQYDGINLCYECV